MPCWFYEKRELMNSPSIRAGMEESAERALRAEGASFIMRAGSKLGLASETCATGIVYFHRFYMHLTFQTYPRYVTAACCLFLAGKVEETPKKCKDIIRMCHENLSDAEFAEFGDDPKEEVMTLERILLHTIKFDLQVDHPYKCLFKLAKKIKADDKEKVNNLVQTSYTFITDSLCTTLSIQWEPEIIAVALIYLASRMRMFPILDWEGKSNSDSKWWQSMNPDLSKKMLEDICHQVLDMYQKKDLQLDLTKGGVTDGKRKATASGPHASPMKKKALDKAGSGSKPKPGHHKSASSSSAGASQKSQQHQSHHHPGKTGEHRGHRDSKQHPRNSAERMPSDVTVSNGTPVSVASKSKTPENIHRTPVKKHALTSPPAHSTKSRQEGKTVQVAALPAAPPSAPPAAPPSAPPQPPQPPSTPAPARPPSLIDTSIPPPGLQSFGQNTPTQGPPHQKPTAVATPSFRVVPDMSQPPPSMMRHTPPPMPNLRQPPPGFDGQQLHPAEQQNPPANNVSPTKMSYQSFRPNNNTPIAQQSISPQYQSYGGAGGPGGGGGAGLGRSYGMGGHSSPYRGSGAGSGGGSGAIGYNSPQTFNHGIPPPNVHLGLLNNQQLQQQQQQQQQQRTLHQQQLPLPSQPPNFNSGFNQY